MQIYCIMRCRIRPLLLLLLRQRRWRYVRRNHWPHDWYNAPHHLAAYYAPGLPLRHLLPPTIERVGALAAGGGVTARQRHHGTRHVHADLALADLDVVGARAKAGVAPGWVQLRAIQRQTDRRDCQALAAARIN